MKRWPLLVIAAPAAVAIWSGWVGLGSMCGFGPVEVLPGIADSFRINTAITLPIGVEAYGAYALRAWLSGRLSGRAEKFAKRSAIGSLVLGMTGQIIYHLLSAAHTAHAPWPVTAIVACMPVTVLGLAAGLSHLIGSPETAPAVHRDAVTTVTLKPATVTPAAPAVTPEVTAEIPRSTPKVTPETAPGPVSRVTRERAPDRPKTTPRSRNPVTLDAIREHYADDLKEGRVPSKRAIKRDFPVGYDTASALHAQLTENLPELVPA